MDKARAVRAVVGAASFGLTLVSHEADVRSGGSYRLVMDHPSAERPMTFFGRYLDVTPPARLVWTNDEGDGDGAVTTVIFREDGGTTLVVVSDLHPSREALDAAIAAGGTSGWGEQFEQLAALVATPPADPGPRQG